MNNMKALLTKDFQINKKTLLMPFWITAGFYLLMIIGVLIAYFRGDFQFSFSHFDGGPPVPAINYIANLTIAAFPGFLCMIFSIMIMQGALNEDLRRKCELFHRSQPVSIWERTGSKFLVGTIGNWLVFLVIVIFNFIVINTIFISLGQFTFNTAIIGLLQSVIVMLRYTILIGSVAFFFSSIFKDKAFFKGIALLIGINLLFQIFNWFLGWNLPLPATYLFRLFQAHQIGNMNGSFNGSDLTEFMNNNWKEIIWNINVLWQMIFSAALFIISTYIYKYKEVK